VWFDWHLFFGCSKCRPHSKECGFRETLGHNKNNELIISKYISCFKKGILIEPKLLYFLLKGSYAEKIDRVSILSEEERISYKSMKILLNKIKGDIEEYSIFITPHIFTKLIHELRKNITHSQDFSAIIVLLIENFAFIKEENLAKEEIKYSIFITPHIFTKLIHELRKNITHSQDFSAIIVLLIENFAFIKEENLAKEEIMNFKSFKNRYCGISETALILLKKRMGNVCIIGLNDNKILEMCGDNYLFIDFKILVDTIKEFERRDKII